MMLSTPSNLLTTDLLMVDLYIALLEVLCASTEPPKTYGKLFRMGSFVLCTALPLLSAYSVLSFSVPYTCLP